MELRQPKPRKNKNWVPVIMFKNEIEVKEFDNIQEVFRYIRPFVSYSNRKVYDDIIHAGVWNFEKWYFNGDVYEFRTYEERRLRHLEEERQRKAEKVTK
ncbi:hypothetical protein [Bacillus luti]|uniref:Uncharacterized protein n=1 Tax=Bacillus luti TaxID=2026191 RepID=A0A7V7SAR7_9BACI|nr:hypothetical protein [Bacillus luti]KAB2443271.1 hypothetical protein F8163_09315 [Bacillus luti]